MNQPDQKETENKPHPEPDQEEHQNDPEIVIHEVHEPQEEHNKMYMTIHWDYPVSSNQIFFQQKEPVNEQEKNGEQKREATPGKENPENSCSERENEGEEDGEGDEQGKSKRNQSSESNRDENDTSQLQTVGGKKCFNKLCNSKKIFKKIRSKVQPQRYRFLCKTCYDNYFSNSFCQFCEQIYSNYENQQDDTKWVGCDKCERWNHIECERKYRHKNFEINKDKDTQYECLSCSKKNRNGAVTQEVPHDQTRRKPVQRDNEIVRTYPYRSKPEINKDERIPIFHKKPDVFPCLESFLQTYNFRLWLNDANIREDIESLRNLNRRPNLEEQPKKNKKVKIDY